jgi:hypothetical protein
MVQISPQLAAAALSSICHGNGIGFVVMKWVVARGAILCAHVRQASDRQMEASPTAPQTQVVSLQQGRYIHPKHLDSHATMQGTVQTTLRKTSLLASSLKRPFKFQTRWINFGKYCKLVGNASFASGGTTEWHKHVLENTLFKRWQSTYQESHHHTVLPLWSIKSATQVRIGYEFHIANVHYDTPTGTPKLVIQLPTATPDHLHNSVAIPLGETVPIALLETIIKDETHGAVSDVRIYDCRSVPDPEAPSHSERALLEPNFLWSKYTMLDELIRESLHGTSQGFFIFMDLVHTVDFPKAHETSKLPQPAQRGLRIDDLTADQIIKYYVRIPQFEERITPLKAEIAELKVEFDELDAVKRRLDGLSQKSGHRAAVVGFSGLIAYWVTMFHYVFYTDYGWDTMEPVSYFFGVGFAICSYAWWLLFSREYTYDSLKHVALTRRQGQLYSTHQFDLRRYETLRDEIVELEKEIADIKVLYKETSV